MAVSSTHIHESQEQQMTSVSSASAKVFLGKRILIIVRGVLHQSCDHSGLICVIQDEVDDSRTTLE